MRQLLLILFAICLSSATFGQGKKSPYRSGIFLDGPIILGSGVGLMATRVTQRKIEPLTLEEIALLNRDNLPKFDRSATMKWSPKAATASKVTMYANFAVPALLFIDPDVRDDIKVVGFMGFETLIITDFLSSLSHSAFKRSRPFLYNHETTIPEDRLLEREARFSMFAGNTARAAGMSFMTAKLYADYNPKSKWKPLVWTAAALLPTITGFLEYKSGEQYPTDIITGYVIGAGVGLLVPMLHKKKKKKKGKKKKKR